MPGVWPTNKKFFSSKMNRAKACTNQFWNDFGVESLTEHAEWAKKTEEERQERIQWLTDMDRTQLPLGPYPFKSKEHGWIIFSLDDPDWNVCFSKKKDFKLGLQYIKSPHAGIDGRGIVSPCRTMEARLMQEHFDTEKHCFDNGKEWKCRLPGKCKFFVCFHVFAC